MLIICTFFFSPSKTSSKTIILQILFVCYKVVCYKYPINDQPACCKIILNSIDFDEVYENENK